MSADEDLVKAVEATFVEWQKEHGLTPAVPVAWVLVVEGAGWSDDDENVEQVMVVPQGSRPHCQGLLKHADDRFTAETLAVYRGGPQ